MKTILFAIVVAFAVTKSYSQTTYIPDDNFEQALIDYGLDDVLDDYVLTESIDTVTFLAVIGREIVSLEGIQGFVALEELDCGFNALESLDVSSNTALKIIGCAVNELSTLDLTNNTELISINAAANNFVTFDITENVNLETLNLAGNSINAIDLSANEALEFISMGSNNLTEIDFSANENLKDIYLSQNELEAIDVTGLPQLKVLSCSWNQISILDLSQNGDLSGIFCNSNNLIHLNVRNGNNTSIVELGFSAGENPDLLCVVVDDVDYSTDTWALIDPWTNFDENCDLGVTSNENIQLNIYPNPTTDHVIIETSWDGLMQIKTIDGKIVFEQSLNQGVNTIEISDLPNGIYTIIVFDGNNHQTKKLSIE